MKREFISAFRSEVWLLARHPATALMIALAAVLYVVAAATSSEVLIMVAGDDPYTLGGAIGFIGNLETLNPWPTPYRDREGCRRRRL